MKINESIEKVSSILNEELLCYELGELESIQYAIRLIRGNKCIYICVGKIRYCNRLYSLSFCAYTFIAHNHEEVCFVKILHDLDILRYCGNLIEYYKKSDLIYAHKALEICIRGVNTCPIHPKSILNDSVLKEYI